MVHRRTDPWPAGGQLVPCLACRKDGYWKSLLLLAELGGKALGGALNASFESGHRMAAEERLNSRDQIQDIVQAALFSERLLAVNMVPLFPALAIHASGAPPPSSQLYHPVPRGETRREYSRNPSVQPTSSTVNIFLMAASVVDSHNVESAVLGLRLAAV